MRERRFDTVGTARASSDQRNGDAVKRFGDAWQSIPIYRGSEKQLGLYGHLERERSHGGAAQTGTISASGVYTAPGDLPILANLTVTATSHEDVSKSGTAIVTVRSDVVIGLAGGGGTNAVPVELGATHAFLAVVSSGAHPDKSVLWTVSGASCPLLCGSVDASGNYTAPQILPASPNVTLTARSVADSCKQVSAAITIASNFLLQLAVPSTVTASSTATFIATLKPVPGSNPSTVLSWSLSGSGRNGALCGTLSVVTEQSAGGKCYCCVGELCGARSVANTECHRGHRNSPG